MESPEIEQRWMEPPETGQRWMDAASHQEQGVSPAFAPAHILAPYPHPTLMCWTEFRTVPATLPDPCHICVRVMDHKKSKTKAVVQLIR